MAEMKDSGIHAIGRIPKEWNVVRTKYLSNISIGLVTTMTENYVEKEEGVPLIRNGNIRCNKIDVNGMVFLDKRFAEKNKHRQLHTGQIATVHTGDVGTSIVIPEEYDGGLGFATIQSTPYKGVSSEFLCWFYNSAAFKNQCIECSTGDGRQNLNLYDFVDLFVAIPKYDLQSKIASFLDKKCAEIDSLHTDIEKQIETLEEYKKSIITEAVTKGLNPDVEMKDSGIEWVGMIPKNWNLKRLGFASVMQNGYVGATQDILVDDGERYIQSLHIKDGQIMFENDFFVTKEWGEKHPKMYKGDILVVQTGDIGQVAIVDDEYDGCNCHALIICHVDNVNFVSQFLLYYLMSYAGNRELIRYQTGTTLKHLNSSKIKYSKMVVPPKDEQSEIVKHLTPIIREVELVIEDKKKQLETLEQYKKSLIYEYVTGKKEVK